MSAASGRYRGDYQSPSKSGISLISLIITIIVIIILAAILIITGLSTPDRANLSKFASKISDYNTAVFNTYTDKHTKYSSEGKRRSRSQKYYEIATAEDVGMDGEIETAGTIENDDIRVTKGLKKLYINNEKFEIINLINYLKMLIWRDIVYEYKLCLP